MHNIHRKKTGEELAEYLKTMKRHTIVPTKKGKGAPYKREKYKGDFENES